MVFAVAMRGQGVWLTKEQARCLALAAEQVASVVPLAVDATMLGSLNKIDKQQSEEEEEAAAKEGEVLLGSLGPSDGHRKAENVRLHKLQ
jgi:hypothetical protein